MELVAILLLLKLNNHLLNSPSKFHQKELNYLLKDHLEKKHTMRIFSSLFSKIVLKKNDAVYEL